jgi:hypothetical protein
VQTLKNAIVKFTTAAALDDIPLEDVTREQVVSSLNASTISLLDTEQFCVLHDMIIERDKSNNGMHRAEAITVIQQLTQTSNRKRCENHYDFLVKNEPLNGLTRGGRVVKAQNTVKKEDILSLIKHRNCDWHKNFHRGHCHCYRDDNLDIDRDCHWHCFYFLV